METAPADVTPVPRQFRFAPEGLDSFCGGSDTAILIFLQPIPNREPVEILPVGEVGKLTFLVFLPGQIVVPRLM